MLKETFACRAERRAMWADLGRLSIAKVTESALFRIWTLRGFEGGEELE